MKRDDEPEEEQLSLYNVPTGANVRPTDPLTSHKAANERQPDGPIHAAVLLVLQAITNDEVAVTDEVIIAHTGGSDSSVRTRRNEVANFGWAEKGGKGRSKHGKEVDAWRLSPRGRRYVYANRPWLVEQAAKRKGSDWKPIT